jgi:hypothetical protein
METWKISYKIDENNGRFIHLVASDLITASDIASRKFGEENIIAIEQSDISDEMPSNDTFELNDFWANEEYYSQENSDTTSTSLAKTTFNILIFILFGLIKAIFRFLKHVGPMMEEIGFRNLK